MQQGNKFPRIAVDGRRIRWREGTGVARYRQMLTATLVRMGTVVEPIDDGGDAAARPAWRDVSRLLRPTAHGARTAEGWGVADLYRLAQRRFSLTGKLLEIEIADPPAIAHWAHPIPVRLAGAANIYTVHDVIPLESPGLSSISSRRFGSLLAKLHDAGHFATVSQTAREALAACGFEATCCYQAVAPGVPGQLPAELVPGSYFLALGRVEPRKNIERLILAHRASGTLLPLVIAGPDGDWPNRAERRRIEALMTGNVRRIGWLPEAQAAALIASAHAVLMPSLAEGFGLPVIEAMHFGVPAMASNIGAQAEIAGDAALLVAAKDIRSIAQGIARLDRDQMLRATLIARGTVRAAEFGIESFADRLARLYERFG